MMDPSGIEPRHPRERTDAPRQRPHSSLPMRDEALDDEPGPESLCLPLRTDSAVVDRRAFPGMALGLLGLEGYPWVWLSGRSSTGAPSPTTWCETKRRLRTSRWTFH